jgi:hypothetical protein
MASFPLFSSFPVEIQLAVWAFAAVLDPQPDVCLVWPLHLDRYDTPPDQPVLPYIVDTVWPAVIHVCRAAREAALKSGAVQLRYSPLAGFAVPYRHFIPAIDTLYWGDFQASAMRLFLNQPENASLARDLRHLSVELRASYPSDKLAEFIREKAVDLRTLSIVFPATADVPRYPQAFLPPARRCRLRNMSDEALDAYAMAEVNCLKPGERQPMPFRKYLDKRLGEMNDHVRRHHDRMRGPEGTAWSTRDRSFSGLAFTAQTFVEYRGTAAGGNQEQWVETCQDRLITRPDDHGDTAPRPRHVWPEDRKNPEEYRVLDDDNSLCSWEENRAYVKRKRGNQPHSWH